VGPQKAGAVSKLTCRRIVRSFIIRNAVGKNDPLKHRTALKRTRREWLALLAGAPALVAQTQKADLPDVPRDWTCPMDQDVHLDHPGRCPRCGMTLVLQIPERLEYPLILRMEPAAVKPGQSANLILRVFDPAGNPVRRFETVHEKLIHLFVVSQDLEFFAHVHPVYHEDGSFTLPMRFPKPGMYRLLADFYPASSVPQLAVETLYVQGPSRDAHLIAALTPLQQGQNLTASIRLEPDPGLTGLMSRIIYMLEPAEGLEKYLGAWGHMLIASEDLIDLIHLHPFLASGSVIQYNAIFPRAGNYKIWSQFQRSGVVNTIAFSLRVHDL
jgi:hypothetical protein